MSADLPVRAADVAARLEANGGPLAREAAAVIRELLAAWEPDRRDAEKLRVAIEGLRRA